MDLQPIGRRTGGTTRCSLARGRVPVHAGPCRTRAGRTAARRSGWALVGDAGYHRDAVTGHGISDAYLDAELLTVALHRALSGDTAEGAALASYEEQRDHSLREVFELTVAMSAYPPVREFVELQKQLSRAVRGLRRHHQLGARHH